MLTRPVNFDGATFARHHNLDEVMDFWVDVHGVFYCPSIPDLTQAILDSFVLDINQSPKPTIEERLEAAELMIDLVLDTQSGGA